MQADPKSLLIIFYRNPDLGKVKTRLAATLGEEEALRIFKELAFHTTVITAALTVNKMVCYSERIEREDIWSESIYEKSVQEGSDLGEKMKNAFAQAFGRGYSSVCIIGTDCLELTSGILEQAFESLRDREAVIGPARDGGYYLLGLRRMHPRVFLNKKWSTDTVFSETVRDFRSLELPFAKLPKLRDVDTASDLPDTLIRNRSRRGGLHAK